MYFVLTLIIIAYSTPIVAESQEVNDNTTDDDAGPEQEDIPQTTEPLIHKGPEVTTFSGDYDNLKEHYLNSGVHKVHLEATTPINRRQQLVTMNGFGVHSNNLEKTTNMYATGNNELPKTNLMTNDDIHANLSDMDEFALKNGTYQSQNGESSLSTRSQSSSYEFGLILESVCLLGTNCSEESTSEMCVPDENGHAVNFCSKHSTLAKQQDCLSLLGRADKVFTLHEVSAEMCLNMAEKPQIPLCMQNETTAMFCFVNISWTGTVSPIIIDHNILRHCGFDLDRLLGSYPVYRITPFVSKSECSRNTFIRPKLPMFFRVLGKVGSTSKYFIHHVTCAIKFVYEFNDIFQYSTLISKSFVTCLDNNFSPVDVQCRKKYKDVEAYYGTKITSTLTVPHAPLEECKTMTFLQTCVFVAHRDLPYPSSYKCTTNLPKFETLSDAEITEHENRCYAKYYTSGRM